MVFATWEQHEADIEQLRQRNDFHATVGDGTLTPSNMTRTGVSARPARVALRRMNRVIRLDTRQGVAWVEPGITMDQLLQATLKEGFIPCVLPEFKGITVAGAIIGAALESSSFRHGQFNDICDEYEVLLAGGRLVTASPTENADLFYGLVGSYGTLGNLCLVKVRIHPAKPLVRLHYHIFDTVSALVQALTRQCESRKAPDFIEGLVIDANTCLMVTGCAITPDEVHPDTQRLSLRRPWSPWYIQHLIRRVQETAHHKELPDDTLPIYDYLFRYDRSAFWMGQFLTNWRTLCKYLSEWNLSSPTLKEQLRPAYRKHPPHLNPGLLLRTLLSWKLPSTKLYRVLHAMPEKAFESFFHVQDFYLPTDKTEQFVRHIKDQVGIYPLWLCPIRGTTTPQLFAPHHLSRASQYPKPDFINVGVYGHPRGGRNSAVVTYELEQLTHEFGGRKVLYAFNHYTPEEFWDIYPKAEYDALRARYDANGALGDIYHKVCGGAAP